MDVMTMICSRWSMISSGGPSGRDKLEGSMLTVCGDCRSMVLEVRGC